MKKNNTLLFGKIPPQATEIEDVVLGCCLVEPEALELTLEHITTSEVFYSNVNQIIFSSILDVRAKGYQVDILTVTDNLSKIEKLDEVGGSYHITKLSANISTTAHLQTHCLILLEKFNARELIRICGDAINRAYSEEEDIFDLLQETEKSIQSISEGNSQSNFKQVGEMYMELMMDIEEAKFKPAGLTGIDTGYQEINAMTDGWQKSNLVVLAARPSVGKTALALNFAINANCGVLVYSLEAYGKELVKRFAACKTDVYFNDVKNCKVTDSQSAKLHQYISYFNKLDIKIDDKTQSLVKIIAGVRREKKKNPNMQLVVIDYLQLVRGIKDKNGNREQEVAGITRELKLLASELEITIIALSQLNREVEKTGNKRPSLANLRESGAIEQDANIVMMIWRKEESETEIKHFVLFEKNRDGKCGDVELRFNGDLQKWTTLDAPIVPPANPYAGFNRITPNFDEDAPF
jgi:replicative DNA helicase